MRKLLLFVLITLISVLVITSGAYFWWRGALQPVSGQKSSVSFVIASNESASSVTDRLQTSGLIRSSMASKIYLKARGLESSLRPGGYLLSPSDSASVILSALISGPKDIWVTIPEGWRREQIALRLSESLSSGPGNFSYEDFLERTEQLEGQLFPDTYLIPLHAGTTDIIKMMTDNFDLKTGLKMPADMDILILASLVEREVKKNEDRPVISGILSNRLRAGWPLQVDASVQFTSDNIRCSLSPHDCVWWRPVESTRLPSLFNTYLHLGLPPAPIANPGLASITAARSPAVTPFWYYLTGSDGQMYYGRTLSEHNSNIDKYLRP